MANRRTWLILFVAILLLGSLSAAVAFAHTPSQPLPAPATGPVVRSTSDGPIVYTVKRGETLTMIARRYGVSVRELAASNGITNPDRIYPGQILRIPRTGQPTVTPPQPTVVPPQPTVTPVPAATIEEEIVIQAPARGVTITSPVVVSGLAASPFEQTVVVVVLDATGGQIAQVPATITGKYGQRGPFSVSVPFTQPVNSQPGRIQVYTTSPRDGALEHLELDIRHPPGR